MDKKRMILSGAVVAALVVVGLVFLLISYLLDPAENIEEATTSNNVIIFIGDGMGPAQVSLARYYAKEYHNQEKLAMDEILVGTNTTFSMAKGKNNGIVTDSAAGATALATGHKSYNGAIAVMYNKRPVASVVEAAELAGMSTGLITTTKITHATPASFAAHVDKRSKEGQIAVDYVDSGVDLFMGGGEQHFNAILKMKFKEQGYEVVRTKEELQNSTSDKILGLFAAGHLPYVLDRNENIPNLSEMLTKALNILENNEKGFVLMVEGGRIDQAAHANDARSVVEELLELDDAIQIAIDYARMNGNTSVMATADHETGGLTIGANNDYNAHLQVLHAMKASSYAIGQELNRANTPVAVRDVVKKYTGITNLSDKEVQLILGKEEWNGTNSSKGKGGAFNAVMSYRSLIGWTTHGHTGVDVNTYAYGPVTELVAGHIDNTDFAKAAAKVIGVDLDEATATLFK